MDKFLSRRTTFRARSLTYAPDRARKEMGAQNQSTRPRQN